MNNNNKKWRNAGLYGLLLIVVLALVSAFLDNSNTQSRENLTYSDFINQVENNQIEQVILSADRTQAKVSSSSGGDPLLVNLPNDPDLINILSEN
ncbi:MAG: ATP-dependent metallopeptidase FtsH/Yme1/Tma family protein, partial [Candidatus Atelocyanobacterium sp. ALOHA_A2.5_9]|nr:ATP-dependent metallopeptidase FtsH/Yme1/Tma family protein [Candidatus Atelocyanobacterium sp. ALOHA_A2.5_9]